MLPTAMGSLLGTSQASSAEAGVTAIGDPLVVLFRASLSVLMRDAAGPQVVVQLHVILVADPNVGRSEDPEGASDDADGIVAFTRGRDGFTDVEHQLAAAGKAHHLTVVIDEAVFVNEAVIVVNHGHGAGHVNERG